MTKVETQCGVYTNPRHLSTEELQDFLDNVQAAEDRGQPIVLTGGWTWQPSVSPEIAEMKQEIDEMLEIVVRLERAIIGSGAAPVTRPPHTENIYKPHG